MKTNKHHQIEPKTTSRLSKQSSKQKINQPTTLLRSQVIEQNNQLIEENRSLKQKYTQLQLQSTNDKDKIKTLLARISQVKRPHSQATPETKPSQHKGCLDREKQLEIQLFKQRIRRNQLEKEKKQWEADKLQLKNQYRQLLNQINSLRNQE